MFTCLSTTHTSCTCHCDWCHLIMILPIRVYDNRWTAANVHCDYKWCKSIKKQAVEWKLLLAFFIKFFFSASCYTIEIEIEKSFITGSSRACKHYTLTLYILHCQELNGQFFLFSFSFIFVTDSLCAIIKSREKVWRKKIRTWFDFNLFFCLWCRACEIEKRMRRSFSIEIKCVTIPRKFYLITSHRVEWIINWNIFAAPKKMCNTQLIFVEYKIKTWNCER